MQRIQFDPNRVIAYFGDPRVAYAKNYIFSLPKQQKVDRCGTLGGSFDRLMACDQPGLAAVRTQRATASQAG